MTLRLCAKPIICPLLIVLSIILIVSVLSSASKRHPKSFRIYYDKIDATILRGMATYDLNIVEATFFEKKDVEYIHANNSQVVGYLSLIEIGYWDTPLVNDLDEEDYLLDRSHEKMKSLEGTNHLGDLSSPHFREILLKYIETRILDKGMDGVFLDTLDWIDYYAKDTRIHDKLAGGYEAFLLELRQRYPDMIVLQNRGFASYKAFSHSYITGILWENFNSPHSKGNAEDIDKLNEFASLAKSNKTEVYVISFENEVINRELANTYNWNFLYSQMDDRYSKWDIVAR